MHAKRQAFITWSEVFLLKQKLGVDTNTPPQVNKDLEKEGRRRGGERSGTGGEETCGGPHTCALFGSQSKMCTQTDSYSHTLN